MTVPTPVPLLVLGAGHVGRLFAGAVHTHRQARMDALPFSLADRLTWRTLPAARATLWTFPAQPVDDVRAFIADVMPRLGQVVVLGTTGSFGGTGVVDESSPLVDAPRVHGERALQDAGATVLRLAGLWGHGRDPARWLLDGRITNGDRVVNLCHEDDVVSVVHDVLARPIPGGSLVVADHHPRAWHQHVEAFKTLGRLPADFMLPRAGDPGRTVDTRTLRARMPLHAFHTLSDLRTVNVAQALDGWSASLEALRSEVPGAVEELAADASRVDRVAHAVAQVAEAARDLAVAVEADAGRGAPIGWADVVDVLVNVAMVSQAWRRTAGAIRADLDGYTGVGIEELHAAAVELARTDAAPARAWWGRVGEPG